MVEVPYNGIHRALETVELTVETHRVIEPLDHPNGSVTTEKLANGSVTTEKLANKSITLDKLDDVILALLIVGGV